MKVKKKRVYGLITSLMLAASLLGACSDNKDNGGEKAVI